VRPPVPRELEGIRPFINVVRIPQDHKSITLCEHLDTEDGRSGVYSTQTFAFDYAYDPPTKQHEVYQRSAQPAVLSVLQGYNATLIAYGQTGTGKTYTMEGFTSDEHRGIIPRSVEEIFSYISSCRQRSMKFLVRASYLQIYNEVISDLLKPLAKQLVVRHTKQRGVYIEGLSEWVVRSPNDVYGLMERGTSLRATSSHKMSELSSRSHAMFIIIVEVMEGDESNPTSYRFGKLNIVDLAGSEKVRQTGVTGKQLGETKKINWSLHELGNVISALTSKHREHIPFRNSCLTSALRDSLGGNCKTTLIACISPALESYAESLSTLKFANRAKNIKNEAIINEDADQGTLLRKYEKELKKLRAQLQERSGEGVPQSIISELEMGRRRAEQDREAALEALQQSSRAHQQELSARKRLEHRIYELENVIGVGGHDSVIDGSLTSDEYASRLDELDKERQVMEEDKAQVDRYKQLLLKQRDIMLNLTTRLNERDETILHLQEEIDAYDAHIQMLEDAMEANSAALSTRVDAQEYLSSIKATAGGEIKYRSEANDHLLTAEEKILELLMIRGRAPNVATPTGGFQDDDERRSMQIILKDRIEVVASREVEARTARVARELDALRTKLLLTEDKRRSLEYLVEMAKQQPSAADPLLRCRRYIEQEQESMRASYTARITSLQQSLDSERETRRKVLKEIDRYRFDLSQVRALVDASKRAELERLWKCVERTEEELHAEMSISSPVTPTSSFRDPHATATPLRDTSTNTDRAGELERALDALRKQTAAQQTQFVEQLQERDRIIRQLESEKETASRREKDVTALEQSLNAHIKDRRALKTIMESRIKTKLDTITELFASGAPDARPRIGTELRALQNLVNASITAMDS
jgi:hypothetical protein